MADAGHSDHFDVRNFRCHACRDRIGEQVAIFAAKDEDRPAAERSIEGQMSGASPLFAASNGSAIRMS